MHNKSVCESPSQANEFHLLDALRLNVIDLGRERQKRLNENIKLRVREVIKELPDLERTIIHLCFWHGLDFSEIAQAINVSENVAYDLREAALNRLKKRFCELGIDREYLSFLQKEPVK